MSGVNPDILATTFSHSYFVHCYNSTLFDYTCLAISKGHFCSSHKVYVWTIADSQKAA